MPSRTENPTNIYNTFYGACPAATGRPSLTTKYKFGVKTPLRTGASRTLGENDRQEISG